MNEPPTMDEMMPMGIHSNGNGAWSQARTELAGFAHYLDRTHSHITAAQLRLAIERADLLTAIEAQLARIADVLTIKASTCEALAVVRADIEQKNWRGLADELNDTVWCLKELSHGRLVEALKNPQARLETLRNLRAEKEAT